MPQDGQLAPFSDPLPDLNTADGPAAVPGVYTWTTALNRSDSRSGRSNRCWISDRGTLTRRDTRYPGRRALAKNLFWGPCYGA